MKAKVLVLLSGGPDSGTLLRQVVSQGKDVCALTFKTVAGEDRDVEFALGSARAAEVLPAKQFVVDLTSTHRAFNGITFLGGATDDACGVPDPPPQPPPDERTGVRGGLVVMHTMAAVAAMAHGCAAVYWGVHKNDVLSGEDQKRYAEIYQNFGVSLKLPFLEMTKKQVINLGLKLGLNFEKTWSCADKAAATPCERCEQCRKRNAFRRLFLV